jgi:hypothetical protein
MTAFRGRAGDSARFACRAFPGDPFILKGARRTEI